MLSAEPQCQSGLANTATKSGRNRIVPAIASSAVNLQSHGRIRLDPTELISRVDPVWLQHAEIGKLRLPPSLSKRGHLPRSCCEACRIGVAHIGSRPAIADA
jgi:hypothetical protein